MELQIKVPGSRRWRFHSVTNSVRDAPDRKSWFGIGAEAGGRARSASMDDAVAKYYEDPRQIAVQRRRDCSWTVLNRPGAG